MKNCGESARRPKHSQGKSNWGKLLQGYKKFSPDWHAEYFLTHPQENSCQVQGKKKKNSGETDENKKESLDRKCGIWRGRWHRQ